MHLQNVPASSSSNSRHVGCIWGGGGENIVKSGTRRSEIIKEKIHTFKIYHSGSIWKIK